MYGQQKKGNIEMAIENTVSKNITSANDKVSYSRIQKEDRVRKEHKI